MHVYLWFLSLHFMFQFNFIDLGALKGQQVDCTYM